MRFISLAFIAIGITGVILYLVADYDYSNFIEKRGVANQIGLRDWVRFYHDNGVILFVVPLLSAVVGVIGVLLTFNLGPLRFDPGRSAAKIMAGAPINIRQLALVIVVAAIVGGGSGWLGANFKWDWITGDEQAQTRPRFTYQDQLEQQRNDAVDRIIREQNNPFGSETDRRIRCLEDRINGIRTVPC